MTDAMTLSIMPLMASSPGRCGRCGEAAPTADAEARRQVALANAIAGARPIWPRRPSDCRLCSSCSIVTSSQAIGPRRRPPRVVHRHRHRGPLGNVARSTGAQSVRTAHTDGIETFVLNATALAGARADSAVEAGRALRRAAASVEGPCQHRGDAWTARRDPRVQHVFLAARVS